MANEPISVFCAGRTDAGVHATGQVIHFNTDAIRPDKAWVMGVNALLPDSVAVTWVTQVAEDFHARFSATARRYRYIISNQPTRPAILSVGLSHYRQPLDEQRMHQAAQAILGENDFSSFRAAQCQSNSPNRFVHFVNVTRANQFVVIDIKANAFVHHMVRNIAGSLITIGRGDKPVEWMAELLDAKDRTLAAETAKPNGLYLVEVSYPEQYSLPQQVIGPLFLA